MGDVSAIPFVDEGAANTAYLLDSTEVSGLAAGPQDWADTLDGPLDVDA